MIALVTCRTPGPTLAPKRLAMSVGTLYGPTTTDSWSWYPGKRVPNATNVPARRTAPVIAAATIAAPRRRAPSSRNGAEAPAASFTNGVTAASAPLATLRPRSTSHTPTSIGRSQKKSLWKPPSP